MIIPPGEQRNPVIILYRMCRCLCKLNLVYLYKIIDIIVLYIPVGVFGLMTNAMATYGTSILGNIFKFILTDYLSAITHSLIVYVPLLLFVAKVNPIKYLKVAFESWLVAFSTCTSMASLPVSMKNAKEKLGIPEETASFVLPFGATANYRIIDQIHTATNATGDLVVAACVASTEGTLDRTAPAYTGDVKKINAVETAETIA